MENFDLKKNQRGEEGKNESSDEVTNCKLVKNNTK